MKTNALRNLCAILLLLGPGFSFSQVAISTDGSSPDNSAMLEVKSPTKGLLLPRLSDVARDAMANPAQGLIIFNTTSNKINYYGDGKWYEFTNAVCVPDPTTANAGPDQVSPLTTVSLAGNTPVHGTGTWAIISGTGGSITNIHNPASLFTGNLGVGYILQWTISTPCNTSTDNVTISLGSTCSNGLKDGTETDVDCGGSCPKCANGKNCNIGSDCQSGVCVGGVCHVPSCTDGIKDGSETDVDCGGASCPGCAVGKNCNIGSDCQSGFCAYGVCQATSCTDGVKDGTETDVDCGGSCTTKCAVGKYCNIGGDCQSGFCANGVCQATSCTDGIKDGSETDVDCGGASCPKCALGKACNVGGDCQSGVCVGGVCLIASCANGYKDGTETDVDCGGSSCAKCASGKACNLNSDCLSGVCTGSHVCQ